MCRRLPAGAWPVPVLLAILLVTPIAAGCSPSASPSVAAGGHADDPEVESHTVHTASVEHFVEHPPLVAGVPTKLAAHATDIRADWLAVRTGTATIIARRDGREVARTEAVTPSRPGIFGPVITIPTPGDVELRVRVETPEFTDEAPLGVVEVHASAAEAASPGHAHHEEAVGPARIAFLKEQQWRIDFRCEPAGVTALVQTVRVPGRVVPRTGGRAVVSAPATGRIVLPSDGALVSVGAIVEEGQVLGAIEPVLGGVEGTQLLLARAELEVREIEAAAELGRAQARLERAQRVLARAERLRADGAGSERELDDARFEVTLGRADVDAAEKMRAPFASIRGGGVARTSTYTVPLTAPIRGTVVETHVVSGEFVEGGRMLFEVVDLDTIWIEGDLPEASLERLPDRPRARCLPAAIPGALPHAEDVEFVQIHPRIDAETRSVHVSFRVPNADRSHRLGAAMDLLIETGARSQALAVAESALVDEDGRMVVFVQLEGEAFEKREVKTGLRAQGRIELLEGVRPGERVVVTGAYAVRLQTLSATLPEHGHAH